MIEQEHKNMVTKLVKPGATILEGLTPDRTNLLHMAIGIVGEGGEVIDAAKRVAIYGKGLTPDLLENLTEELGDLEFYMEGLRQEIGVTREETLQHNIAKLDKGTKDKKARYADGYSDEAAIDRADKE